MPSRIYESAMDKKREGWVGDLISDLTGLPIRRRPILDTVDFQCSNPDIVFEIKCRKLPLTHRLVQGQGLFLSRQKWRKALKWTSRMGHDLVIAYGLTDGVFVGKYKPERNPPKEIFGGRMDRSDGQEWLVLIPASWLTQISDRNVWKEVT